MNQKDQFDIPEFEFCEFDLRENRTIQVGKSLIRLKERGRKVEIAVASGDMLRVLKGLKWPKDQ